MSSQVMSSPARAQSRADAAESTTSITAQTADSLGANGNDIKVNGAGLVCGGIKASNGTLYLIDTVLMPPATTSTTTSPTP